MTHPFPDLHDQLHPDCNPAVFRHFPLKTDDFTSFMPWAPPLLIIRACFEDCWGGSVCFGLETRTTVQIRRGCLWQGRREERMLCFKRKLGSDEGLLLPKVTECLCVILQQWEKDGNLRTKANTLCCTSLPSRKIGKIKSLCVCVCV